MSLTAQQRMKCAQEDSAYQQLLLGEAKKVQGQALVASHNPEFVEIMRTVAVKIAQEKGTVTSDDLREYADRHGLKPKHANVWGCVFSEPGWTSVGFIRSRIVSNHARTIRIWSYAH